jgi:hypothetical protein
MNSRGEKACAGQSLAMDPKGMSSYVMIKKKINELANVE